MKVLLVDDNGPALVLLANLLREAGLTPVEARGGEQALEILEQIGGEIDVVVADLLLLGVVDGRTLIRQIRDGRANCAATTPIIAISAGSENMPAALALGLGGSAGADLCLFKPFRARELLDAIAKVARDRAPAVPLT